MILNEKKNQIFFDFFFFLSVLLEIAKKKEIFKKTLKNCRVLFGEIHFSSKANNPIMLDTAGAGLFGSHLKEG